MYGRTPSPEIMNHFSSLCFALGMDRYHYRRPCVSWPFGSFSDESELLQSSEDSDALEEIYHKIETKTERSVQRKAMMWKPINFDKEASYAYLLAKSPYDYACARKVLQEIKNREPEFQPRTFFDYGSGVGAAIW